VTTTETQRRDWARLEARYIKARLAPKHRPRLALLAKAGGLPVRTFAGLVLENYLSRPFRLEVFPFGDKEPE
jgi:hypothetical protein